MEVLKLRVRATRLPIYPVLILWWRNIAVGCWLCGLRWIGCCYTSRKWTYVSVLSQHILPSSLAHRSFKYLTVSSFLLGFLNRNLSFPLSLSLLPTSLCWSLSLSLSPGYFLFTQLFSPILFVVSADAVLLCNTPSACEGGQGDAYQKGQQAGRNSWTRARWKWTWWAPADRPSSWR